LYSCLLRTIASAYFNVVFSKFIFLDHYSKCSKAKELGKDKERSTLTIKDIFERAAKRKTQEEETSKRQKRTEEVDSDIDISDCEK
jgi:hypothetical protein